MGERTHTEGEDEGFDRAAADARARAFFDGLWTDSDPWDLEASEFDQRRYERQFEQLSDRRYSRALEIGVQRGRLTVSRGGWRRCATRCVPSTCHVTRSIGRAPGELRGGSNFDWPT